VQLLAVRDTPTGAHGKVKRCKAISTIKPSAHLYGTFKPLLHLRKETVGNEPFNQATIAADFDSKLWAVFPYPPHHPER
jgi:hypothetical protein